MNPPSRLVSPSAWADSPHLASWANSPHADASAPTSPWTRALVDAPRWMLLLALVLAPWAYGSTRPVTVLLLSALLIVTVLLWSLECVVRGRRPDISPWLLGPTFLLLGLGWWMTLNAHSSFDWNLGVLFPQEPWIEGVPGTVDRGLSLLTMVSVSGILGAMLLAGDLARRSIWRKRLWMTMTLAGCSIALFGLVQKLGGREVFAWMWETHKIDPANNFAGYRYRANAGAYLNLVLPLIGFLVFWTFQTPRRPFARAGLSAAAFILLAGIQFNPSRASWGVALAIIAAMIAFMGFHAWRHCPESWNLRASLLAGTGALVLAGALGAIICLGGWETSWNRISKMGVNIHERGPTEIYRTMVPDAGWSGFGPGTFRAIFPAYQMTHDFGGRDHPDSWVSGFWEHAHNDYYETLIDWGWLGSAGWAAIVLGALVCAARRLRSLDWHDSNDWLMLGCALGIGGVFVHAIVDFPLQVASIQLYVAVMLGICWGLRGGKKAASPQTAVV